MNIFDKTRFCNDIQILYGLSQNKMIINNMNESWMKTWNKMIINDDHTGYK